MTTNCAILSNMKRMIKGFTLMEVLVCCTLLVTVIGLSAGLLLTASRHLEQSRTHLLRTYVAEQLMEEILEAGFDDVETLPTSGTFKMETTLRGRTQRVGFTYEIKVVQVSSYLKSVLLTIGQGNVRDTSYETLLTDFL